MADWSGKPAYLQVAEDLRARITRGELAPGNQLPSYEALMKRYGVSITVIRNAIRELRTESLVRTHQGKGVFVSDPLPDGARLSAGPELGADPERFQKLEARVLSLEEGLSRLQEEVRTANA